MAYRESCAGLISRLRDLIGDPAEGATPTWNADQLQSALDRRRQVVRYLALTPAPTTLPGGSVEYLDYFAPYGDWQEDASLTDASGTVLTPSESDFETGHWAFAANTLPTVYLTGYTYDLYAAAADVLEKWAGKEKLNYTWGPGSGQYVESQKFKQIGELALQYRAQQRVEVACMRRSDVNAY